MMEPWGCRRAGAVVLLLTLAACSGGQAVDGPASQPPAPRGAITVVAAGDISTCPGVDCGPADTAALVDDIDPKAVLTLGDNQYPSGELVDFQEKYAKTWGRFTDITHPAPGNHEYYASPDADGYFDYFGAAAHPDTDGYYSFNLGDWHLVALNSNDECKEVACDDGSEQQRWFADDLAASDARCTLAYWHHPRWSTGEHRDTESSDALWQTAADGGVDLVLNGHDHDYERFVAQDADGVADKQGTVEIVAGTGGVALRDFAEPAGPLTAARVEDHKGVLRLDLGAQSYAWQFVAVGGDVLDQGRDDCS
ncbi:MAG: metallophosphoesterase [Nocardioidaceae bacterium]|nr:metallophosphoesterase [Nocardioidaceae bacterium]